MRDYVNETSIIIKLLLHKKSFISKHRVRQTYMYENRISMVFTKKIKY